MHLGIKMNNSPWSICWRLQAWDVKAVSGLKIDIWCNWLCSFLFITEHEGYDWRGVQILTKHRNVAAHLMTISLVSCLLHFIALWIEWCEILGQHACHTRAAASIPEGSKPWWWCVIAIFIKETLSLFPVLTRCFMNENGIEWMEHFFFSQTLSPWISLLFPTGAA